MNILKYSIHLLIHNWSNSSNKVPKKVIDNTTNTEQETI